ncbi:MAG TPA: hypothetical protein VLW45_12145 [Pelomicrobium sp.]|nr:hypothetical protein [Pelomicrobium sp.]
MNRRIATLAVAAALGFAAAGAQATTIGECQMLAADAMGTVQGNSDYFTSNNRINECLVKMVESSAKGKPATSISTLSGPMSKDECSMYNYLSSVDSKLEQAKLGDAKSVIDGMVAKIDTLYGTGKLIDPGYTDVRAAAAAVQTCVGQLLSQ